MSDFARSLQQQVNNWAAAYLQFQTGRQRENFAAYAFVEDDDDKSFYQTAIPEYDNICYLGCGGKSGVITVFRQISKDGNQEGNLFFCDRDTEEQPFEFEQEVLRSPFYSWESHVCEPTYVGWFLQRKLSPNLTRTEKSNLEHSWAASRDSFKDLLAKFTSLCFAASCLNKSLEMHEIRLSANASFVNDRLIPDSNADYWYGAKLEMAVKEGLSEEKIKGKQISYMREDVIAFAQGKALFEILREFVKNFLRSASRESSYQLNSAKAWALAMPCTDENVVFVRDYVARRLMDA